MVLYTKSRKDFALKNEDETMSLNSKIEMKIFLWKGVGAQGMGNRVCGP